MWIIIGFVLGILSYWLVNWTKNKGLALNWYEWVIGIIGLFLLVFTLQNFLGSFTELEPKAAYLFLLVTGLPAVILLALTWQLVIRRAK
ncbi:dehalogenase [Dehalococcoides sp. THU3]|uniref:hypothetical protein n=1 Tax=Dehalococcoides TaxID=61434 RepID=UPI0005B57297|nr:MULTISPECIES: hypothetical protein [Dehalococcoides]QYY58579.1 dehalogenase [Dehalococcoides mccartyi]BAQ34038.1 putative reductive dehalogenase membrane anchoring protein [Dehalococcoides sp. UCH007]BEL00365.1 hypothetical protein DMOBY_02180 [Dehalococcoides mccartyi]